MACPLLVVFGICHIILGILIKTSIITKLTPFIACAGLALPIFIDQSLGKAMQITGTIISIVSIIIIVYLTIIDIKALSKTKG